MSGHFDKVYATLLARIESGEYQPGEKLPAGRVLAKELGATLWATRNATLALEEAGFVESRPPLGVFACETLPIDKVRRHKNSLGKKVMVMASRSFYYVERGRIDIIGDMERRLVEEDHEVDYADMPDSPKAIERLLNEAADNGTKALVIFPERREWDLLHQQTSAFAKSPLDIIYFNRGLGPNQRLPFSNVSVNVFAEGKLAAHWVAERDIERVAYLTNNAFRRLYWAEARHAGFQDGMERNNRSYLLLSGEAPQDTLSLALDFVKKSPKPPALVACNDVWAEPVYNHLTEMGLNAGKEYHTLSFDCSVQCENYPFVNIGWPLDKVGALLANVALDSRLSAEHEAYTVNYTLKPLIINRENS